MPDSAGADTVERAEVAGDAVAFCGWHPEHGYALQTCGHDEQHAASLLMRADIAGNHGWSVQPLYDARAPRSEVLSEWPADTPEGREEVARMIYNAFPYDGPPGKQKPDWIPNGNSFMQDRAREAADSIIWALRPALPDAAQASQDPFVAAAIAEDAKWPDPILGAQASPWQPIETAPKDHFVVLICGPYGRMTAFRDVNWDWWQFPASRELGYIPTHWMPLPDGPALPSAEGK